MITGESEARALSTAVRWCEALLAGDELEAMLLTHDRLWGAAGEPTTFQRVSWALRSRLTNDRIGLPPRRDPVRSLRRHLPAGFRTSIWDPKVVATGPFAEVTFRPPSVPAPISIDGSLLVPGPLVVTVLLAPQAPVVFGVR